jgi:hypothetical protein
MLHCCCHQIPLTIKSRTAKDSRAAPVPTACTIVRLAYTSACEDLGRVGTLSKLWRVMTLQMVGVLSRQPMSQVEVMT